MKAALYDPANHRALAGAAWSAGAARAGIAELMSDAASACGGPQRLWPNAREDLEGDADVPYRSVYFGAAGMGWALQRLAGEGFGPELPGAVEMLAGLPEECCRDPELVDSAPGPGPAVSLLFGESGIRLAAHAAGAVTDLDALAACVARGRAGPTRELCWGSPGTMTAALAIWRQTGESRWRQLWLDIGVALLVASCLRGDARFPFLAAH
ncbi:MAG TPA: hypothetical protein VMA77_14805 [Solirubrobacteraceae bacterium]|nr:hypothetical protein [Solirubrobacteraceae bacterium]